MSKHTAIYVRVSSRDQSHASQMPDLDRWAEVHGGSVQQYQDKFTGKSMDRPGMEKLLVAWSELLCGGLIAWAEQLVDFANCLMS